MWLARCLLRAPRTLTQRTPLTHANLLLRALTISHPHSCAFEKEDQRFVAAGGLDNICSVYDVRRPTSAIMELVGHDGYLSDCKFLEQRYMLTSSGDKTAALWDVERGLRVQSFVDHGADVMSIATHSTDVHCFVTGSCDATAKVREGVGEGCLQFPCVLRWVRALRAVSVALSCKLLRSAHAPPPTAPPPSSRCGTNAPASVCAPLEATPAT